MADAAFVHIKWTRLDWFGASYRRRGCRKTTLIKSSRSLRVVQRAAFKFAVENKRDWKSIYILGSEPYYDPNVLMEIRNG